VAEVRTESNDGRIVVSRDDGQATLTLRNPGRRNAVNRAMWLAMASALAELAADESLRCLVVRGDGDNFGAGGDIDEFDEARATPEAAFAYHAEAVAPALQALADFPLPTIAEIRGACVGGGLEIACCCDLRIAEPAARFGVPINRLGFSMYAGEMALVLRIVPRPVLAELLFEGRLLAAEEALAKGLLTRVVASDTLAAEVAATAGRIVAGAPLVARAHKQWLRHLADGHTPNAEECAASLATLNSADYREGLTAFREKRAPRFTGR
jgi:enoyl-CoA hydratase/carnithine racemase